MNQRSPQFLWGKNIGIIQFWRTSFLFGRDLQGSIHVSQGVRQRDRDETRQDAFVTL
jgi:hypothetical protein